MDAILGLTWCFFLYLIRFIYGTGYVSNDPKSSTELAVILYLLGNLSDIYTNDTSFLSLFLQVDSNTYYRLALANAHCVLEEMLVGRTVSFLDVAVSVGRFAPTNPGRFITI